MELPKKCRNFEKCNSFTKTKWKVYCSNICQLDFQYNYYIEEWLNGRKSGLHRGCQVSNYVRRYLHSLKGNKCWICGWSEINKYTQKCPLEVDHIDGNWKNSILSNLRLLCPNCHSLTFIFRALNKGNGRKKAEMYRSRAGSNSYTLQK